MGAWPWVGSRCSGLCRAGRLLSCMHSCIQLHSAGHCLPQGHASLPPSASPPCPVCPAPCLQLRTPWLTAPVRLSRAWLCVAWRSLSWWVLPAALPFKNLSAVLPEVSVSRSWPAALAALLPAPRHFCQLAMRGCSLTS